MHRRPVVLISLTFLLGMVSYGLNEGLKPVTATAFFSGMALLFLFFKESVQKAYYMKLLLVYMTVFTFGLLLIHGSSVYEGNLQNHVNKVVEIEGRVLQVEEKEEGREYVIIRPASVFGSYDLKGKSKVLVRLYNSKDKIYKGKLVTVRGELMVPDGGRNPKCFDYKKYLKSRGIYYVMDVKGYNFSLLYEGDSLTGKERSFYYVLLNRVDKLKDDSLHELQKTLPKDQYALSRGMLYGDKNQMGEDLITLFQKNQTAHILAVSGLHVGILYGLLYGILSLLKRRNSVFLNGAMLFIIFIYLILSDFSPSSVRAFLMIFIHIFSRLFYFRFDLLSATLFSMAAVLIFRPFMIFNAGFQLSYMALVSISFFVPVIKEFIKIPAVSYFAPFIGVQAGLAPVICYHFNYISYFSILANIPSVFLTGIILPCLLIKMPLSYLPFDLLNRELSSVTGVLLDWLIKVNDFFYVEGKTYVLIKSPHVLFLIFIMALSFFVASEGFRIMVLRKNYKMILKVAAVTVVGFSLAAFSVENSFSKANIVFVDVGQGDCLCIRTDSNKILMIDSGGSESYDVGEKILFPFLLKNYGPYLDAVCITHLHQDHYGGFKSLSKEVKTGKLILYEGYKDREEEIIKETGMGKDKLLYVEDKDVVHLWDEVKLTVLNPVSWKGGERKESDENLMSLVVMVEIKGLKILMTGDIDEEGEKDIIKRNRERLACDILKVPHHGSKYSTCQEFLKATSPKVAVIQVGKNNFGHPSSQVIEKCLGEGIIVFRNDKNGAIAIGERRGKRGELWIKTMLSKDSTGN